MCSPVRVPCQAASLNSLATGSVQEPSIQQYEMNAVSGLYQQNHHQQIQQASLTTSCSTASSVSPTDSNNSNLSNNPKYQHHQHIQQHHQHLGQQHLSQGSHLSYHQDSLVALGSGYAGSSGNLHQSGGNQHQQQHHDHQHQHQHPQGQNQNQAQANMSGAHLDGHQVHHHHQYGSHHAIDSTTLGSTLNQRKKSVDKGSDEYKKRRERNNVAVRKSREKAKMRSRETERRVAELSKENQLFRARYDELQREFNVLKSLLLKTGLTEQVIEDEAQRHTMQQQISQVSSNAHNHMVVTTNHHVVSSLNNHVGLKMVSSQPHQGGNTLDSVDHWAGGINAYVEEWAN